IALVPFSQGANASEAVADGMNAEPAPGRPEPAPTGATVNGSAANENGAAPTRHPRPARRGHTPTGPRKAPAVAVRGEAVQALADRITEEGVDRGGIVLFTPTTEQLRVTPAIGDLGRHLSRNGDRVLVVDARPAAETPGWAGSGAPAVAASVEGSLDGRPAAPADCFVPTSLDGVEYSRADLASRVSGVIAAHRFRQLVEEMRERYSVVLMVSPAVTLDG